MRLEGVSVRDIAARLGRGKTQIATALASDPTLPSKGGASPTPEQLEEATARRVAAAVGGAAAIPGLVALGALPRGPAPVPPHGLPPGQAPTEVDHDLRIAYLAEALSSDHWQGVRTLRSLVELWTIPLREVQAYADKARKMLRQEHGIDSRKRMVTLQVVALERLAEKAESVGSWSAAVAARRAIIATSPAAGVAHVAGRGQAEGLPPELARLKNPVATTAEVEHFADVREELCILHGCRSHPRPEGAPVPPAGGAPSPSAGPMH